MSKRLLSMLSIVLIVLPVAVVCNAAEFWDHTG